MSKPATQPRLPENPLPSVSAGAAQLVVAMANDAAALGISVTRGAAGERLIDLGAQARGGMEAGRRLAEICLGGLGHVSIGPSGGAPWPWAVTVITAHPVIACLGSQYGGWTLEDSATKYFALGSGPARALARKESLFQDIDYADACDEAALVIEGDRPPPPSIVARVAADCGVKPGALSILYAPTGSLAGSVQIAARALEVALHKAHALHFPLHNIVDGCGTAPVAPPSPDHVTAMGRTNDAIIYGARVQIYVRGDNDAACDLAEKLPSSASADYGRPFRDIFAEVGGDFYKIDPLLFSPAQAIVSNLDTGRSFHAGELAPDIVDASFR